MGQRFFSCALYWDWAVFNDYTWAKGTKKDKSTTWEILFQFKDNLRGYNVNPRKCVAWEAIEFFLFNNSVDLHSIDAAKLLVKLITIILPIIVLDVKYFIVK